MSYRTKLLQTLRCQLIGHHWSVWRKFTRKHEQFRICTNCDKRETKLMTSDQVRAHEARNKRPAKRETAKP